MMLKSLFAYCFFLCSVCVHAQYYDNWFFGLKSAISFDSSGVSVLPNSQIDQLEGVASFSDMNGDILFYTDGMTVYNAIDSIMPNGTGLAGNATTTMSGFIVPWIGRNNKYLLFSLEAQGAVGGVKYSIVDMALDGGLGDVDTTAKNVQLIKRACEKIAAVQHVSDTAIWIVIHPYDFDGYYTYLLSRSGLDTTPVVSQGGVYIGPNAVSGNCIGYLTTALDGTKMAAAHRHINRVETMDFNRATGVLSNFQTIDSNYLYFGPYGVEFSPNKRFLYVNENNGNIYQYDLQSANPAASRLIIDAANDSAFDIYGAIQVGPDSMLYVARGDRPYLSRIENPDQLGLACQFVDTAIGLFPGFADSLVPLKTSRFGLPKNVPMYKPYFVIDFTNTCLGDTTLFFSPKGNFDSIFWDFGDPLSGVNNFSNQADAKHYYTTEGTYLITLHIFVNGVQTVLQRSIVIQNVTVSIIGSKTLCKGDSATLYVQGSYDHIEWSTGETGDSLLVSEPNLVWVRAHKYGCIASDTVLQQFEEPPQFSLGNDTTLCLGDSVLLGSYLPGYTYTWQDGINDSLRWVSTAGLYELTLTSMLCSSSQSIKINVVGCDASIDFPNVFSPNNDGANDYFMPIQMENVVELEVLIYNRWGSLVHQSTNLDLKWDGTDLDNKKLASGVYFWIARYIDTLEVEAIKNGTVTLLH